MMARANHLDSIFIGLLAPASSPVETAGATAWIPRAVSAGRGLLCASAALLIYAQFHDHSGLTSDRIATLYGCILALAGGVLLAAKAWDRPNG